MKRAGRLFDDIVTYDNLRFAVHRALKGKRHRPEVREWVQDLDANLTRVVEQLHASVFPFGRFHQFVIFDPKQRLITAPCFEERVVHHAVMNVVEPHLERWLIHDTFACRKGFGRIKCLSRARKFAARYPWFLKMDVRKYFDSVPHDRLLAFWSRRFKDPQLLTLISSVVRSYRAHAGKGLPIGALTSQHLANFYLGWLDRFVKERLKLHGYVRYMDDIALWVGDGPTARRLESTLRRFLADELELQPKPEPYANRTDHGMDFLGCRVFPSHLVANRSTRLRFTRKWRALSNAHRASLVGDAEFQARATSLVSIMKIDGISSWRFRSRTLHAGR
jgi:hypothetical protein